MTGSSPSLTPLQRELLAMFFEREREFRLTGGAALVEFYLHHRFTKDLDLFGGPGADLDRAERALRDAALAAGAEVTTLQRFAEFRRLSIQRGSESTIVDLAIDRAPTVSPTRLLGNVVVDSLEEIAANKLCAVLGRAEPRDLVDLMLILRSGVQLTTALTGAGAKDGGADAATLAWVIGQIRIGSEAVLPAGISAAELEAFRADLELRLRKMAFPSEN
ncbi:MAG: nucleotidyl transferase AbiEii/AbiGii toxin family protein [Myxococcales bacterium]|nr:nucleotidyl transferase AbiEii/AbiGii toxin family protein [Myxococcales bacterium]